MFCCVVENLNFFEKVQVLGGWKLDLDLVQFVLKRSDNWDV